MEEQNDRINILETRLNLLMKRHEEFAREIARLKIEIQRLKKEEIPSPSVPDQIQSVPKSVIDTPKEQAHRIPTVSVPEPPKQSPPVTFTPKKKSNLEKFIGENLINKIGILITIIGVAIGAKYAIDNELISPLTRIVIGYLVGLGLLGFAIKLKSKYENYSAVLLSGAMAIMYFITYAAYSFYGLIPQTLTFIIMVIFTAFTATAAVIYNKQVIAHIGLVGAYAVPFLLSDGSGNVKILFSYMAIINIGILAISFKKYWKTLLFSAFGLTWLIYTFWYIAGYRQEEHFSLALVFMTVFFGIFYLTFLAYKFLQQQKFEIEGIVLLLLNSFIAYGVGFAILNDHETGQHYLGLYTLLNALVHFVISIVIFKKKLADKNLFFLVSGLVLVFITIAIPVQLDGSWVTILWVGEAALLFWIGRTKNVPVYETLSYPVMVIAFFSLVSDWSSGYGNYYHELPELRITPILNVIFLTSALFAAAFAFILYIGHSKKYAKPFSEEAENIFMYGISGILVLVLYQAFALEIRNYWNQLFEDSVLQIRLPENDYDDIYRNTDLTEFKTIWVINYSLFFASTLAFVNFKWIKNKILGFVNIGILVLVILAFLTSGLYAISELRDSYLGVPSEYYQSSIFHIGVRYVSLFFFVGLLLVLYKYPKQEFIQMTSGFRILVGILLHGSALWFLSSELIHWMHIGGFSQTYKLGLSILWGIYSLYLISIGIWKKKKHLRIMAIVLFGITLAKLFIYDISHLDTIAKTIVFVSLGILLLIISFLYNKYKHIISNETEE